MRLGAHPASAGRASRRFGGQQRPRSGGAAVIRGAGAGVILSAGMASLGQGIRERWPLLVRSFLATFAGGAAGWAATFAGFSWGLALGVAVTLLVIGACSWRRPVPDLRFMLGFAPAFALLTWPALYIGVGLVRWWLTGETLGS